MPAGRPTKYSKELLKEADYYLHRFKELGDEIPSAAGLAIHLDISRRTIYDWAKEEDKAAFSHILDKIQAKQEQVLINKGLNGDFNSAITKLVLGKHGYHEKQDVGLGGGLTVVIGDKDAGLL